MRQILRGIAKSHPSQKIFFKEFVLHKCFFILVSESDELAVSVTLLCSSNRHSVVTIIYILCFAVCPRIYCCTSSASLRVFLPELESQGETPRLPPSLDVFRKRTNQKSYWSVICTSIFCPRESDKSCRLFRVCSNLFSICPIIRSWYAHASI